MVRAVPKRQKCVVAPVYPRNFAQDLAAQYSREGLIERYARLILGQEAPDAAMRRIMWLALTRSCGSGPGSSSAWASSNLGPSRSATASSTAARHSSRAAWTVAASSRQ